MGELLHGSPELGHVTGNHHGIVAGVETAHGVIERNIRGQSDKFIPFPGFHVAHLLKAIGQADVHVAGSHGFPPLLETDSAGGATPFRTMGRLGAQPQIILNHDAGHQLAGEMVGKIRAYAAVHQFKELRMFDPQIGKGIIVGFFYQGRKSLVGPGLGEFRHPSGNDVNRSHLRLLFA